MKKRIISFLLVMALLLSMAPMVTIEAEATEIIYEASEVVDIALEYANKAATGWSGYCLSFVRQCFKDAYGFNSSDCCAYQYGSKYMTVHQGIIFRWEQMYFLVEAMLLVTVEIKQAILASMWEMDILFTLGDLPLRKPRLIM